MARAIIPAMAIRIISVAVIRISGRDDDHGWRRTINHRGRTIDDGWRSWGHDDRWRRQERRKGQAKGD